MIIDIHGHYTTEPAQLHAFRDKQLASLADPGRKPSPDLGISDEELVKSVQPQLKLQRDRGSDLTIFSPRASGMGHHVGNEAIGTRGRALPTTSSIASARCCPTTSPPWDSCRNSPARRSRIASRSSSAS